MSTFTTQALYKLSDGEILATGEVEQFVVVGETALLTCFFEVGPGTHKVVNGVLQEYPPDIKERYLAHEGEGLDWDATTGQWEDTRTLQDFKDAQWTLIKLARTNAEYAGFTWDGSTFDSDAISQNRITGAVTLAMMSPAFVIDWVLADNTTRLLDQSGMAQVGAALGTHVATQFAKGVMLRAAIEAATTQAEVEAVVW